MTPEKNWSTNDFDHVKPLCLFNVSKDDLKEALTWKRTQPLIKKTSTQGTGFCFIDSRSQFIKTYQFIKIKEEGFD